MEWVASRSLRARAAGPGRRLPVVHRRPRNRCSTSTFQGTSPRASASSTSSRSSRRAAGWTNVPTSFSPAKQTSFTACERPDSGWRALGRVRLRLDERQRPSTTTACSSSTPLRRTPRTARRRLRRCAGASGRTPKSRSYRARSPGRTAGFHMKLIDLSADAETFRLYFTSVQRANATYNALGAAGSTAFEETLNKDFPTSTAADFAPLEAGIVDEDTYVEQGLKWTDAHWAYLEHIIDRLGVEPDLLLLGNPVTDEFHTSSWRSDTPTDMDGDPNPYFDDVDGRRVPDGRMAIREGYIRSRVRGGRRDARSRARADGRRHDGLRLVRPRLRAAVVRGQRQQGARGRRSPDAEQQQRAAAPRTAAPRPTATAEREGVPGGRHGADLRQPDAASAGPDVRGGPDADHQRVPEPDRPGQPGQRRSSKRS